MTAPRQLAHLLKAEQKRREALERRVAFKAQKQPKEVAPKAAPKTLHVPPEVKPPPEVEKQVRDALIPLYRDDNIEASAPSSALIDLADLYLHAAKHRTRHVALVWPATFKTLTLVHALASLARWKHGDNKGVRGLLFPVKGNVFYPLNHIHFDRGEILRIGQDLLPAGGSNHISRPMPEKAAFFFSLSEGSLQKLNGERFNPAVGELLPHFLAAESFARWESCEGTLLELIRAKLKRAQARALQTNCSVIGAPDTAPDAIFALDGRMPEEMLRKACRALARGTPPEVVLVSANRAVRLQASAWKGQLARFCLMLEEVFGEKSPGVVVVTDEPYAAFRLKDELWDRNGKRPQQYRWRTPDEFKISGIPSTAGGDGLLDPGASECAHPTPREFDVHVVDSATAKVANKLNRIANDAPGGRTAASALVDAAGLLSRIAALPCGTRDMAEYLCGPDIADRTRFAFDWGMRLGAVRDFERTAGLGDHQSALREALDRASELVGNYNEATPFAHKLASLVSVAANSKKRRVAVVFTHTLYRRLAERFLERYDQYPAGIPFSEFKERVFLIAASQIAEHLDALDGTTLVFAGLNEDSLRLLITDERVPAHAAVLITQRAGQFLRGTLKPLVETFPEFKSFKPRMESILRQLRDLPEDKSVLSTGDYVLPTFRVELSSDASDAEHANAGELWEIRLDNEARLHRRDSTEVYIYDPASQDATEAGFRTCKVSSLQVGDKLFVMSGELREMVEQVLLDAGVSIHSDKSFEGALRDYHSKVWERFSRLFPDGSVTEKVARLREEMLANNPRLSQDLPAVQSMRHWIDLGRSPDTPFEELRPQAPRDESVFKAFAQVLGFSDLEAAWQWQRVIMVIRNRRRQDGRHVSDIYAYMLLQPESAMANSNIKRQTLTQLFQKARENVATVDLVIPPKQEHQ